MVLFICMHLIPASFMFCYLMIAMYFCLEGNSFIFLALFDGILVLLMIILSANFIFVCQEENDQNYAQTQLLHH